MLECINGVIANNLVKNFGYELSTKAKLCDFWISLLGVVFPDTEASSRKVSGAIPLDESRARDLISCIEDHYSEKITLDELAASVHISKSECCRCFKRALNVTPIEYLMKYRIYMAANLIRNKDPKASSFSDLAYHVGFNNASYFNKVFKQYLNCTPSAYKRKLRQDPNFDPFNSIV
jgi:AraC-like DNA-binding protein